MRVGVRKFRGLYCRSEDGDDVDEEHEKGDTRARTATTTSTGGRQQTDGINKDKVEIPARHVPRLSSVDVFPSLPSPPAPFTHDPIHQSPKQANHSTEAARSAHPRRGIFLIFRAAVPLCQTLRRAPKHPPMLPCFMPRSPGRHASLVVLFSAIYAPASCAENVIAMRAMQLSPFILTLKGPDFLPPLPVESRRIRGSVLGVHAQCNAQNANALDVVFDIPS